MKKNVNQFSLKSVFFTLLFSLIYVAETNAQDFYSENAVVNGSAADGLNGWTIEQNGGNGWQASTGSGTFTTSYARGEKSQVIDLSESLGLSDEYMDTAPAITIADDYRGVYTSPDVYFLTVELRGESGNVIASYNTGDIGTIGAWQTASHTFTGYGSGVRSVYFSHGGQDVEYWWGYYGARMTNAEVKVKLVPVTTAATYTSNVDFTANWGVLPDAISYRLDVSTDSNFSSFVGGYQDLNVGDVTSYEVTGLTPSTTYYYRVRGVSDTETSSNSDVISVTTGKKKIWNGTSWTADSPPTIIDKAVIKGLYDTGVEGEFSASNILIKSAGSVVVSSGTTLTVANEIKNNNHANDFVVKNNANLIQLNPNAVNIGSVQIEKDSSPLYRLDYTLWSSPVLGQNLNLFSPETLTNRFYNYNETTNLYSAVDPLFNSFEIGKGYLIRMADNHPAYVDAGTPGTAWTGIFEGTMNNGRIEVATETNSNGFNLVGNPYPSPIRISDFYAANSATLNTGSALYFWRKRNDPFATTYATITNAAYTANTATGGDTGSDIFTGDSSNWVINVGQGFFVEAIGSSVIFDNTMRADVNNGQFFRSAQQETVQTSRLWLNLTSQEGKFSQMAVVYNENMTLGMDYGWDGKALVADGAVTLYSTAADTDLAIQARPAFDATDEVTVGFYAEEAGVYTISLDHVDGLFTGDQDIYLIDNVTGQLIDIKNEDYEFATAAGTINDRFTVVYNQAFLGIENVVLDANEVVVYQNNGNIIVNAGTLDISGVTIYDMRGRVLYTNNNVNTTETVINNLKTEQQVLILNITTDRGMVAKKVVL
ncbi:MAG: hypothetical protein BM557_11845 [Flavobacterium sp. MedPE-SWcel]|uniref:T9SS sorting signal type C domain-containing protein n=1 Tax=uncultured Flavobacterium sp. TaxID=165435 RepID=UPI0009135651|nr:T9SS sorting signal type C domain-containing protein [uncultured Flavobacterium sp.]OIQ15318.1 MAG: hypothetical protein BM557_11845 [Flavobacterium sp. MedPE-SWcel]